MLNLVWLFCELIELLWPWNFPDKNTGSGCHFLFQGILPTQGSNLCLLSLLLWLGILYHWATWEVKDALQMGIKIQDWNKLQKNNWENLDLGKICGIYILSKAIITSLSFILFFKVNYRSYLKIKIITYLYDFQGWKSLPWNQEPSH